MCDYLDFIRCGAIYTKKDWEKEYKNFTNVIDFLKCHGFSPHMELVSFDEKAQKIKLRFFTDYYNVAPNFDYSTESYLKDYKKDSNLEMQRDFCSVLASGIRNLENNFDEQYAKAFKNAVRNEIIMNYPEVKREDAPDRAEECRIQFMDNLHYCYMNIDGLRQYLDEKLAKKGSVRR